ncbi:GNAT family N-acetyltransferase [Companilactobacillus kedongensis]|uniref:GNAT family N-acetyltransferase n=1 Tax=Companilactobacillus kedongensis TaxID=2486004 RepID=UPI001CDBF438|nr:GNAT family N-acetyltransferase [Companilactobacillus kedongensis]
MKLILGDDGMKHVGTIPLETDRLILRRLTIEDSNEMFNNWASDYKVTKYLTWHTYQSVETAQDFLVQMEKDYFDLSTYVWGIMIKETHELIGTISVVNIDEKTYTMELGYCIGSLWWGHGYAPEALERIIEYLFDMTDVNRIETKHDDNNPNSGRVMTKCHMRFEGILRDKGLNNNGVCDEVCYSILRREYRY